MNGFGRERKLALIGLGGVALAFILFVLGLKADSGGLVIAGLAVFILSIVGEAVIRNIVSVAIDVKSTSRRSSDVEKATAKYQPLLVDERTKQDPDVQRLLQYLSVQKAFFDPDYIYSSEAQKDPHVRELIEVFDRMLAEGMGINGDFGGRVNLNPNSAYVSEMNAREVERREREKNRPRRIAGTVLVTLGMVLFFVPFFAVLFDIFGKGFAAVFALSPIGMTLAIIGSIIKK